MKLESNRKYKIVLPHHRETKTVHVDFKLKCPHTKMIIYVLRWWRKQGRYWEREVHTERTLEIWNCPIDEIYKK